MARKLFTLGGNQVVGFGPRAGVGRFAFKWSLLPQRIRYNWDATVPVLVVIQDSNKEQFEGIYQTNAMPDPANADKLWVWPGGRFSGFYEATSPLAALLNR